jgi:glucans biosynthesis protein C
MQRRLDLDWVRIAAFFLLVLYHIGMYYVTWDWHVKSPYASEAIEPLMLLTSPWRLSLLFMVSGVATAFLFAKTQKQSGGSGFLAQRSWRLLVPLIFGMLVIVPPQSYYEVVSKLPGGYHDGYLAFWGRYLAHDRTFCADDDCLRLPTWNHLWFVAYLWVYTLIGWGLLRFAPKASDVAGRWLERRLSGIGVLLWPALLLIVGRAALVGRFPSTHDLTSDWYNHAQYLPLFLLGMLVATRESVWNALQRLRWWALLLTVAGYAMIVWYFYASGYDDTRPPPDALRMLQRVVWALFQWTAIAAIFGFARGITFRETPALHYLREAVFPVYILHQTIIIVIAYNLQPIDLHPAIEGPLLVVITFGLCFTGFEIVRRVRWLRPLFGLKGNARRVTGTADRASDVTITR